MTNGTTRKLKKLIKLIAQRQKFLDKIDAVNQEFQPKLDVLLARRLQKTQGPSGKAAHLSLIIKGVIITLTGTEISALRKLHPTLKELP